MVWVACDRESGRTDAEDDQEDDESVHHREERGGDGGDHLLEGVDAAEEADDAEGAHELDKPIGDIERAKVDEGHEDDENVEVVPAVVGEEGEPVGVHVDSELNGEVDGEYKVEGVHDLAHLRGRAILQHQLPPVLRLKNAGQEILRRQDVISIITQPSSGKKLKCGTITMRRAENR